MSEEKDKFPNYIPHRIRAALDYFTQTKLGKTEEGT